VKDSAIKFHNVRVVVAIKSKLEFPELKTVSFFSIVLGFLNLADHPIVHVSSPFQKIQKGTRAHACLSAFKHHTLGG
jgi:hypothetical protein